MRNLILEPHKLAHPEFLLFGGEWYKWRVAYEGGRLFIDEYLRKYSAKESDPDFALRRDSTYCPRHAGSAIDKIKNSIYQRMVSIVRKSTSVSYMDAVSGLNGGVDNKTSTMNYFMGYRVLPELLVMGKVGVYVDMPEIEGDTLYHAMNKHPYLYVYQREQIINWTENDENVLTSLLLRDNCFEKDEETGFSVGVATKYRYYVLTNDGVMFSYVDSNMKTMEGTQRLLRLPAIPFVIFEIPKSLMTDTADYQIALLNMESSDINYAIKSNFPFYVEQYDLHTEAAMATLKHAQAATAAASGTSKEANTASDNQIAVGGNKGRRIPKGLEFPKFINPSPEPLKASMEKQEAIKADIQKLLNLSLANIKNNRSSADSKEQDRSDEECGLSCIGLELEAGERRIAYAWHAYENNATNPFIKYPETYELRSFSDSVNTAVKLIDCIAHMPSNTGKKQLAHLLSKILLSANTTPEEFEIITREIESCEAIVCDPKNLEFAMKNGLIGSELASQSMGYPKGESDKAKQEHVQRLAAIAAAQSTGLANAAARGVPDLAPNPNTSADEKDGKRRRGANK